MGRPKINNEKRSYIIKTWLACSNPIKPDFCLKMAQELSVHQDTIARHLKDAGISSSSTRPKRAIVKEREPRSSPRPHTPQVVLRRRPGRPKGSKNKPKAQGYTDHMTERREHMSNSEGFPRSRANNGGVDDYLRINGLHHLSDIFIREGFTSVDELKSSKEHTRKEVLKQLADKGKINLHDMSVLMDLLI